ncbi:mycofactocin-coupled SDR family oxidoreductase [Geodermatophilus ruber]|uniref:(+)-trans-carveol dehydrogenase n=1 Tax=Geodermatophilus ruber TaxID=504800 RepID=A0A1I4GMJ6_9ACTN|nr:mycofactocin-coupled SDR family oxidoreductase [Geodermatophilus ruber]SFL31109.1 (+)-trans-carveol dehydrogenase [Geodermatophilus ruber]
MSKLEGKVALVTGAARGQGRSHAVSLASEGADIIAIDLCAQIDSVPYPLSTPDDLAETAKLVEQLDRRITTHQVDIRDLPALTAEVHAAVAQLGGLDIVCVNAGIASMSPIAEMEEATWRDVIDVNLTGAFHTVKAAIPHVVQGGRGGSFILTSSSTAKRAVPNLGHYVVTKHGILGLTETLAIELAPHGIRVNAVLPTQVDTPMIQNPSIMKLFMPYLDEPTRADAEAPESPYVALNLLPVPWIDPVDVSRMVVFLASDDSRYVTGAAMTVDAGYALK